MDEAKLKRIVAAGLSGDNQANKEAIASDLITLAVMAVGRVDGADFNTGRVSVTLIAGQAVYEIGTDILSGVGKILNVSDIYHTDRPNDPVTMLGRSDFFAYASGLTGTGRPTICTLYMDGDKAQIEFCRTPDSAYTLKLTYKKKIDSLAKIPDHYHDVVMTNAMKFAAALSNGTLVTALADAGIGELSDESLTAWNGTVIPLARSLYQGQRVPGRTDSGNLR